MSGFLLNCLKQTLKGTVVRALKQYPGTFGARRRWLNETQWWDAKKLKELQLYLLKRIISHAYESVPFYNNTMKSLNLSPNDIQNLEDIQKLPIICRKNIEEEGDRFVSRKFCKILLATGHSGGTTGRRLVHKRDLRSIADEHAFVRRQYDWAGVGMHDRCARMMQQEIVPPAKKHKKPYAYDAAMKELYLSTYHLSKDTIPIYAKAISDYNIKTLVAYPSAAYALAKGCLDKGIRVPLKAVLTTSETLNPAKKQIISNAFECKVYDFYGGGERICYIHTCEYGSYHIIMEYGVTELVPAKPPNDDSYRIIATGFWNMAMPLIRYNIGDLIQLSDNTCPCGRAFPVVKKIIGRESNILTTPSGRTLGVTAIEDIMENVLFSMKTMNILEAQMIQESPDVMTLEYVPLDGFPQKQAQSLKSLLEKHLPEDFQFNVRSVEKISRTVSGKALSLVISPNH